MGDKYLVDLSDAEQAYLFDLIKKGKTSVRKVTRAHILLQAAEEATDEEIADALRVGVSTGLCRKLPKTGKFGLASP